ncbi:MAG: DUF2523 domain-containing protein [Alteromonadaceae bacterium]|nr:DUF2523 domain-containing protein [Alteromonadaceae bacterium]
MLDWFAARWNDLVDLLYSLLLSLFDILKDLFYWILEQLLSFGAIILGGVGSLMTGLNVSQYMTFLPSETIHIISIIGLGEAMGMIVTCLTVRFFLQLIPFVRWGS